MKTQITISFLILMILTITISCGRNRLKTDEKTLAKQILTEEEQLAREAELRTEREKQLADSIAKLPKGFRFKEDRSIDPQNPPVVIDIIGSRTQATKKFKLSQFFSKIEYIRLESLPDSNFYKGQTEYFANDNFLYCLSKKGIVQFNHQGEFVKHICKNEYYSTFTNGYEMVTENDWKMFIGSTQANLLGNDLFYRYENRREGIAELMKYNENSSTVSLPLTASENGNMDIVRLGEEVANLPAREKMVKRVRTMPLNKLLTANLSVGKTLSGEHSFVAVTNSLGDTVCPFKDFDPIRNFTKSAYRIVDDGNAYYLNGTLFLRQSFNDTIYQLIPPNRLIPKYILNFGSLGIQSAQEGIDPGVSLKEKLVPQAFQETDRYLFITYSKDYGCPNTAKSGTLKYSRLIYDKKNKITTPIYLDEAPFIPGGKMTWPAAPNTNIENDLDAMPFYWPSSVTANGKPFATMNGEEILKLKMENLPVKNIHKNDRIIAIYH